MNNLSNKDRRLLIKYRLNQAEETIRDVELLIAHHRYRAAINRIYYGMFYSLLALGLAYQFETSKHVQLIGWFNKEFIHTNKIEAKYGKIINKAYNKRTKSDYDTFVDFDFATINDMYEGMKLFISRVKVHITNNN